ncbi:hypothetical protein INR49_017340, partial [Caranx melampygus]
MSASWKQLFFQVFLLLISCRHISTKASGPTPSPAPPTTPLPTETSSVVLKGESHIEKKELFEPVNLTLECTWTGHLNKQPNITGYWKKDGVEIQNSRLWVELQNEQYNLQRVLSIVSEKDLGNYSCIFGDQAKIDFILAVPVIGEVRDKPIVSYVGDYAVILCKMDDAKPKPISWNWYRANGTDKEQISSGRYEIKNEEGKTKLVVQNLTEADSGMFYCEAVYAIGTSMSPVELRVITLWEPLKPFIAIVAEVVVLVVAILLYERSQSKKVRTEGKGMKYMGGGRPSCSLRLHASLSISSSLRRLHALQKVVQNMMERPNPRMPRKILGEEEQEEEDGNGISLVEYWLVTPVTKYAIVLEPRSNLLQTFGSEEVPGQFVAMWVLADSHDHVWEVLSLHNFTQEALLHHPANRKETKSRHVPLLHQFVERYEFSKALSHSHDLRLSGQSCYCPVNRPDQLEDVVDEAGAVVAAQGSVVVLQQFDNGVPSIARVVDHVVTAHVHIELHPVHLLWQVQDVCMEECGVKTR